MNPRRRRDLLFSGAGLALALGALAALNVVAHFWSARWDLSAGRAYSLAPGTRAVLSRLQDDLVIRVYYTRRLPPPYGLTEQYLRDLLGEYRSAGRGRVRVEFVDPSSEERRREATEAGVASVPINVLSRDKFEVADVMMGVVFLYSGKREVLPLIEDPEHLEYGLTRRLKKLVDGKLKTVGFVTGHGEKGPDDPSSAELFAMLRQQIDARSVALDKPLPADIGALWVVEPSQKLKPAELAALKSWVEAGKTLGVVTGAREVDPGHFSTKPFDNGLSGLLAGWGLELSPGLVVDAQCENIKLQSRFENFFAVRVLPYPYMPVAKRLDRGNPATSALDSIVFQFVHPLWLKKGAAARYTSLADSSALSWYRESADAAPGVPIEKLETDRKGPFSLAGVLDPGRGKVVVVASQYLVEPRLPNQPSGLAFFSNLLDWSLQDEDLVTIRGKGLAFRPLRPLSDSGRAGVKLALILALPAALLAAAAAAFFRRRARLAALPALYADA